MAKTKDKMTKAETTAWLVGQYQLSLAIVDSMERGYDMATVMEKLLKIIGESSRENDNMILFFATIELRQKLAQLTEGEN